MIRTLIMVVLISATITFAFLLPGEPKDPTNIQVVKFKQIAGTRDYILGLDPNGNV